MNAFALHTARALDVVQTNIDRGAALARATHQLQPLENAPAELARMLVRIRESVSALKDPASFLTQKAAQLRRTIDEAAANPESITWPPGMTATWLEVVACQLDAAAREYQR